MVKRRPRTYAQGVEDANKSRVERERSVEYLNRSPIPGESRIIRPVLDNFSKTQEFYPSDEELDDSQVKFIESPTRNLNSKENMESVTQDPYFQTGIQSKTTLPDKPQFQQQF